MKLSKTQKRIIGAVTLWMLVYPLVFIVLWFAGFTGIFSRVALRGEPPIAFFAIFMCAGLIYLLSVFLNVALMGFYWAYIIKNTTTADVWRIIFGVGIYVFGYFAMPLYFYVFVWREETPTWARPTPPPKSIAPVVP